MKKVIITLVAAYTLTFVGQAAAGKICLYHPKGAKICYESDKLPLHDAEP